MDAYIAQLEASIQAEQAPPTLLPQPDPPPSQQRLPVASFYLVDRGRSLSSTCIKTYSKHRSPRAQRDSRKLPWLHPIRSKFPTMQASQSHRQQQQQQQQ